MSSLRRWRRRSQFNPLEPVGERGTMLCVQVALSVQILPEEDEDGVCGVDPDITRQMTGDGRRTMDGEVADKGCRDFSVDSVLGKSYHKVISCRLLSLLVLHNPVWERMCLFSSLFSFSFVSSLSLPHFLVPRANLSTLPTSSSSTSPQATSVLV